MSMITGCPACGTQFRVVPDQLRISEGWVRCGHCGEVFDASANLRPEGGSAAPGQRAPGKPSAPPAGTDPPRADIRPGAADAARSEPVEVGPVGIAPIETPPAPVEPVASALLLRAETGPDLEPGIERDLERHLERERLRQAAAPDSQLSSTHDFADAQFGHDSLTPDEEAWVRPAQATRSPAAEAAAADAAPASRSFPVSSPPPLEDADPDDLSFVRQARRHAFWRRPGVRLLLLLMVLLLAGLLAAQYAVHDRNRLAAQYPKLRPWLAALCAPLDCRLGPPQRIESIVIDNSGFTRVRPDTYRFSVSLRNSSDLPVAMPALQLTLTDSQDQPVVQRVFMPRELGATSDSIAPGSAFAANLALAVNPGDAAGRIAGYRLLAFYP